MNIQKPLFQPLIQIPGKDRYDLAFCNIDIDNVKNWSKYKTKLNMSNQECEYLYKLIKSKLMVNVKEVEGKNGLILHFAKKIDSESFNDLLRQFIVHHKICSKCLTPELVDNMCKACGFSQSEHAIQVVAEKSKPTMLSKSEKDAIKAEKKREKLEKLEKKKPNRKKKKDLDLDLKLELDLKLDLKSESESESESEN